MALYLISFSTVEDFNIIEAQNKITHLLLSKGFTNLGKPTSNSIYFSGDESEVEKLNITLLNEYVSFLYFVVSKIEHNSHIFPDEDAHNGFLGNLSDISQSLGLDVFEISTPSLYDPIGDDF